MEQIYLPWKEQFFFILSINRRPNFCWIQTNSCNAKNKNKIKRAEKLYSLFCFFSYLWSCQLVQSKNHFVQPTLFVQIPSWPFLDFLRPNQASKGSRTRTYDLNLFAKCKLLSKFVNWTLQIIPYVKYFVSPKIWGIFCHTLLIKH